MKKYLLLLILLISCSEEPQIGDFCVLVGGEDYLDSGVNTCFLSEPGTAVFIMRVTKSWGQETDPSCEAVDLFRWTAFNGFNGEILASTENGPAEGSTIELFDPTFAIGIGDTFLVRAQKVDGRWFAHVAYAIDTKNTVTADETGSKPNFATNWPELESDIKAKSAKFESVCPAPHTTAAEFVEYSKPIVPNYHDRPQCNPNPKPAEECTEANGCLPDDGDDSN